jgi:hypothetical protein
MSKIIIDCKGVSQEIALERVKRVIMTGRISEAGGINHYCWVSEFPDELVYVRRKRSDNSADSFIVTKKDQD